MLRRLLTLTACLLNAGPSPAQAQEEISLLVTTPLRFESWQPTPLANSAAVPSGMSRVRVDREDRWLITGAVGAVAGIVFCTAMSTLINDSASGGLSFCPLDSYVIMGGAGFVLGAAVGAAF